jgi:hypothetical protein
VKGGQRGEDRDHCDGIVTNGGHLVVGSAENGNPWVMDNGPTMQSIAQNGEHDCLVVVRGVDLWCGVPPEVQHLDAQGAAAAATVVIIVL